MVLERKEYPIILRMQGLRPDNMGGFEKHRPRQGGDLGHVNETRSKLSERVICEESWRQLCHHAIREMRLANHFMELDTLKKRRRKTELQRRMAEGARDPWRSTRHGPMREIILTADAAWFEVQDGDPFSDDCETRDARFQRLSVAWRKETLGDNSIHARCALPRSRKSAGRNERPLRRLCPAKGATPAAPFYFCPNGQWPMLRHSLNPGKALAPRPPPDRLRTVRSGS